MTGFACEWRRLLGYHAFATGLTAEAEAVPLAVGKAVHACLEHLLRPFCGVRGAIPVGKDITQLRIEQPLGQFKLWLADEFAQNRIQVVDANFHLDTVEALVHLYASCVQPWLLRDQTVLSVEQELLLKLANQWHWMARPDLITKKGDVLYVHDFKTSVYEEKEENWRDSLQMMLNCYAAQLTWKLPVGGYYIHALKKGTLKSPTSLTHPYYRPANPPFQSEQVLLTYEEAKGTKLGRARIREHQDLPTFIWGLPSSDFTTGHAKVMGPFPVAQYKVNQFMAGLPTNESHWLERLNGIDWSQWSDAAFQAELDKRFPRTYECTTYNRQCDYYGLCFKQPGWDKPFTSFRHRAPHHTTEPIVLPLWPKGDKPK